MKRKKQEIIECACGCGITFKKYDKQWRSRKYLHGHHRRRNMMDRFLEKIKVDGNGCWNWQGYMQKNGYGQFGISTNKSLYAHRVSYELFNKESTKGKYVCHKCDNPSCVNPDHLYLGTQLDNIRDSIRNGKQKRFNRILDRKRDENYLRRAKGCGIN